MLNYEYISQVKYTEAISSNIARKLLWFEITEMLIAVTEKIIVSFITIFGTLVPRISDVVTCTLLPVIGVAKKPCICRPKLIVRF